MAIQVISLTLFSYLLGSIPFGYILIKILKKGDIRQQGSGNIGMTNVSRIAGTAVGFLVLLLDTGKGFLSIYLSYYLFPDDPLFTLIPPLACVLGHIFPVFLKGKGGKGVATTFGTILFISPQSAVFLFAVWTLAVLITRISSIGSLSAALLTAPMLFLYGCGFNEILYAVVLTSVIFFTHRENIRRLLKGVELKI
jgi:glycerol-3-phosphate acyltransferase PlsY